MSDHVAQLDQSLKDATRLLSLRSREDTRQAFVDEMLDSIVMPYLTSSADYLCCKVLEDHVVDYGDNASREVVHYTSLTAMVSMLEALAKHHGVRDAADAGPRSVFRLYDSAHLNDPDEGEYLFRDLAEKFKWLVAPSPRPAYVGSFILPNSAQARDNLVFWRAYGEEGTGCSLWFRIPRESRVLRVLYGSEHRKRAVERLEPLFRSLNRFVQDDAMNCCRPAVERYLARVVSTSLESIRYLYKSSAYAYENECRIVRATSDIEPEAIRLDCRTPHGRPAYLRHYCAAECLPMTDVLSSNSVITIGPRVPQRESVRSCFSTLLGRTAQNPVIKLSEISYQVF